MKGASSAVYNVVYSAVGVNTDSSTVQDRDCGSHMYHSLRDHIRHGNRKAQGPNHFRVCNQLEDIFVAKGMAEVVKGIAEPI